MFEKIKEFQEQSKRTAPFKANPENKMEFWNVLANYSVGLVGEHLEYELELEKVDTRSKKTIPEELMDKIDSESGDVMHYAVNLLSILGEEFDSSKLYEHVSQKEITEALKDILELHKKHIYHGHELQKEKFIDAVYLIISEFYNLYQNSFNLVLDKNIEKLKKRYPNNFNVEDSIKRVDTK